MKILFLCPEDEEPIGAWKVMYQCVDVLNQLGFKSYILHNKSGFRHAWFKNTTPILYHGKNNSFASLVEKDDILVMDAVSLKIPEGQVKCVIFNQSAYLTFGGWNIDTNRYNPYLNKNIKAVITVSKDSFKYIQLMSLPFPVFRISLSIDESVFCTPKPYHKRNLIIFMSRRNFDDLEQVYHLLRLRKNINNIDDYEFKDIDNTEELKVARIMKEAKFFLNFGYQEGFGLPAAEAMKCGCVVIGYNGEGGNEYFKKNLTFKVRSNHIKQFVFSIEKVLKLDQEHPEKIARMGKEASLYVSANYNSENFMRDMKYVWGKILDL